MGCHGRASESSGPGEGVRDQPSERGPDSRWAQGAKGGARGVARRFNGRVDLRASIRRPHRLGRSQVSPDGSGAGRQAATPVKRAPTKARFATTTRARVGRPNEAGEGQLTLASSAVRLQSLSVKTFESTKTCT